MTKSLASENVTLSKTTSEVQLKTSKQWVRSCESYNVNILQYLT